uniref:Chemokine interleukin-8-like domain-containing protein n=1 Tax=Sinocyclocheilus rhinocerous TaxID=307959 RepID=A0A673JM72_9TELE
DSLMNRKIIKTAFILNVSKHYIQVVESQYVPKTCQCPQAKIRIKGPFSDFKVTPKGPNCLQDEIIVIRQKNNNHVCLSPEGRQGKRLLKCKERKRSTGENALQSLCKVL